MEEPEPEAPQSLHGLYFKLDANDDDFVQLYGLHALEDLFRPDAATEQLVETPPELRLDKVLPMPRRIDTKRLTAACAGISAGSGAPNQPKGSSTSGALKQSGPDADVRMLAGHFGKTQAAAIPLPPGVRDALLRLDSLSVGQWGVHMASGGALEAVGTQGLLALVRAAESPARLVEAVLKRRIPMLCSRETGEWVQQTAGTSKEGPRVGQPSRSKLDFSSKFQFSAELRALIWACSLRCAGTGVPERETAAETWEALLVSEIASARLSKKVDGLL